MSRSLENRKLKLIKKSERYKNALSGDFQEIKKESKDVGIKLLYAGGVLLAGWIFYKFFQSDEETENLNYDENSTKVVYVNQSKSSLFNSILNNIAMFLLNIAKEKLTKIIAQKYENIEK